MSKRSDIDVFYIVTTVEDSSTLMRKIGSVGALRGQREWHICATWQEARCLWREHYVDAYRVVYSGGALLSLEQKWW